MFVRTHLFAIICIKNNISLFFDKWRRYIFPSFLYISRKCPAITIIRHISPVRFSMGDRSSKFPVVASNSSSAETSVKCGSWNAELYAYTDLHGIPRNGVGYDIDEISVSHALHPSTKRRICYRPSFPSSLDTSCSYTTCEKLTALILICFRQFGYNSVVHQNFSILHWVFRRLSWPSPSDVSLLSLLLWKNATRRRIAASEGWMIPRYECSRSILCSTFCADWRCVVSLLNKNWNLSKLLRFSSDFHCYRDQHSLCMSEVKYKNIKTEEICDFS